MNDEELLSLALLILEQGTTPDALNALRYALDKAASDGPPARGVTVDEADMLRLLSETARMRAQVTELQAANTHYLERARKAEGDHARAQRELDNARAQILAAGVGGEGHPLSWLVDLLVDRIKQSEAAP